MPRIALVFRTEVVPGTDDEFNRWSNTHHIPEYSAKLPGVTSIRRFYGKDAKSSYITVYEFDNEEDLRECLGSKQYERGNQDAATQVGKTVRRYSSDIYQEILAFEPKGGSNKLTGRRR